MMDGRNLCVLSQEFEPPGYRTHWANGLETDYERLLSLMEQAVIQDTWESEAGGS